MTQLARLSSTLPFPALVAAADTQAQRRFLEFFAVAIRNPNTRKAYMRAASEFLAWCDARQVRALVDIEPLHVAAWIEQLGQTVSAPTVKQKLAGIRHLFDWLVTGHVLYVNPAASVRGPAHSVRRGKTPALAPDEARQLLDSIDLSTEAGLRDRALIALMVYSFARIGAALKMRVEDVYTQQHRLWVRLHEEGGKQHEMPCHHTLESYLRGYIETAGLAATPKAPLFCTIDRKTKRRSGNALPTDSAFRWCAGGRLRPESRRRSATTPSG